MTTTNGIQLAKRMRKFLNITPQEKKLDLIDAYNFVGLNVLSSPTQKMYQITKTKKGYQAVVPTNKSMNSQIQRPKYRLIMAQLLGSYLYQIIDIQNGHESNTMLHKKDIIAFANELLMPQELIQNQKPQNIKKDAKKYGVTTKQLEYRLKTITIK